MRVSRFVSSLMLAILLFVPGCEEDQEQGPAAADPEISGSLVRVEGCKSSFTKDAAGSNSSCMRFEYDAASRLLKLTHINAGFNCCPEEIRADIAVEKGVIRIVESEVGPNCRCNCLFDLYMEVEEVPGTVFTVTVVEPLRSEDEPAIEFRIDLRTERQGEHCVPRNVYPWGE